MKDPLFKAIAVLFIGTIVLPGCLYVGPWWWGPDHDGHWERHHEWRERHGALTPQHEQPQQRDNNARRGHDNTNVG